jgi:hypothetical protein
MRWRKSKHWLAGIALLAFGACTKHAERASTPEEALEHYVTTAFSAKSANDRQALLALSTGEARAWLESMSVEDFKKQFVDNNMVFQSLKSKDLRHEQSGDVSLVYELAFKDGKTPNAAAYTNKKIAFLTRDEEGKWKIKATKNIKSFVERKDDLVVPPNSPGAAPATPETMDKNNGG